MFIDTHCHIHNVTEGEDFDEFGKSTAEDLLTRAAAADVKKVVAIGTSAADSQAAQKFAEKYSGASGVEVFWTYGVHPGEFEKEYTRPKFGDGARPVAIGEVGLDYHYGPEFYQTETGPFAGRNLSAKEISTEQIKLLEEMLDLAVKNDLPLSFHVREAFEDFLPIIDNFPGVRGVIHSFTDNKRNLREVLERGFFVGVNGAATYSTLPLPPLERVLTETDAPYLAPVPHRHEVNEPAFVSHVSEWLAAQYGVSAQEVATQVAKNTAELFGI